MELIDQHVESLIFTAGQPISEKDIATSLHKAIDESISEEEINASLGRLVEKYKSDDYAFEIVPISKGYHFMTKGAYHNTVGEHLKIISKKKLSRAALETLAIVAYKQPVTRIDLEAIRGVGCDYTIQKLMEKELVEMQGRSPGPGRPLLYGTSDKFMDYFGIKDLKDLPKPKDFEMPETEVGEPAPIEVVEPNESTEGKETESTEGLVGVEGEDKVNEETIIQEDAIEGTDSISAEEVINTESEEIEELEPVESATQKLESKTNEEIVPIEVEKENIVSDEQVEFEAEVIIEQTDESENSKSEKLIIVADENKESLDKVETVAEEVISVQLIEHTSNEEPMKTESIGTESIETESSETVEFITDEMTVQDQDSDQQGDLIIKNNSSEEEE